MTVSDTFLDRAFATLVRAAVEGRRCPVNGSNGITTVAMGALARRGDIRTEVFTLNWRAVTILTGPHAGKATAPCPHGRGAKPYRTIDTSATPYRKPGQQARGPSAPRPLTQSELDE